MRGPRRASQVPSGEKRSLLLRSLGLLRPYARAVVILVVLIGVARTLQLSFALLMGEMVDAASSEGDRGRLNFLVMVFGAAIAGAAILGLVHSVMQSMLTQSLVTRLRDRLFSHLQRLSMRFYTQSRTGEILSRATTDVNQVQGSLGGVLSDLLPSFATVIIAAVLMVTLDWRLMLLAVSFLPFLVVPTIYVGTIQRRLMRRWHDEMGEMSSHLEETLSVSGSTLVRVFGRAGHERIEFQRHNESLRSLYVRRAIAGQVFGRLTIVYGTLVPGLIFWFGGHAVIDGDITIGTVVTFSVISGQVFEPFVAIARSNTTLLASLAVFERIFEYIDLPVEVDEAPDAIDLEDPQGAIAFERVSFAYTPQAALALDDISFEVEAGETIALVGPSGAGKTTVTYLIQRFYDPTAGTVRLDGHDVRDLTLRSLPRTVGSVMQETYLFHMTFAENIRYGRLEATDDEVRAAAHVAGLEGLIERLPDGMETVVGQRGYRLSGGERQRVAIARAILNDPPILLLDEATASLDSRLERQIREATRRLSEGRTVVVIAHRLSTVVEADRIVVLDEGRLVDQGTHAELLARGGLYAELYREQFASGTESLLELAPGE